MLQFRDYTISMQEVPGEVSLVFNILGCSHRCKGCHSPELWEKDGLQLETYLDVIIPFYKDMISCVCLMGDGNDLPAMRKTLVHIKAAYGHKICLYTGSDDLAELRPLLQNLDYLKVGSYMQDLGGLSNPNTNQRFYRVVNQQLYDETHQFQERMTR